MEKTHTVLIADDQELIRTTMAEEIASNGFKVLQAKDGEQALVLALSAHPDLLLLDVEMPNMNGMEVIEKVRADEWGKNVPIIILTSFDTTDQMISVISKYNPSFYLKKDETEPEMIVEKIKETLKLS